MKKFLIRFFLLVLFPIISQAQNEEIVKIKKEIAESKDNISKSLLYSELAYNYVYTNPDQVLTTLAEAEKLAKNEKYSVGVGRSYMVKGNFYYNTGDTGQALECYLNALHVLEKTENEWTGKVYNNIGNIYSRMEDYALALQYYNLCYEMIKKEDPIVLSKVYMNKSVVFDGMENHDSALFYANKGLEMVNSVKNSKNTDKSMIYYVLGIIQNELGQKNLAFEYYKLANKLARMDKNERLTSESYLALGKIYKDKGIYDSLFYYSNIALKILRKNNYLDLENEANLLISDYYKKKDKLDSAYFYMYNANKIKDSIFSQEQIQNVKNLGIQERARQTELENQKQADENERKTNIQFAIAAIGIISFIILYFLLSNSSVTNEKFLRFLGILALLLVFEFINLIFHSYIAEITHHSPILMLLALVLIASLLIPLHHRIEKWVTNKMVEKNRNLRLKAAQKTIKELSENTLTE